MTTSTETLVKALRIAADSISGDNADVFSAVIHEAAGRIEALVNLTLKQQVEIDSLKQLLEAKGL